MIEIMLLTIGIIIFTLISINSFVAEEIEKQEKEEEEKNE